MAWAGAVLLALGATARSAEAHGHLTVPASSRHGGSLEIGGDCKNEAYVTWRPPIPTTQHVAARRARAEDVAWRRADSRASRRRCRPPRAHLPPPKKNSCFWFSNNVQIPGAPTLPDAARTVNRNATGAADVYATSPWRAPGSAPVYGSGCGAAGGGPTVYANGGYITSHAQVRRAKMWACYVVGGVRLRLTGRRALLVSLTPPPRTRRGWTARSCPRRPPPPRG